MSRTYVIKEIAGDWALDIPLSDDGGAKVTLYFKSRNNAELVRDVLIWEDAHPNEAKPYDPTNRYDDVPLTVEQLRHMGGQPYWHVGLQKNSPPPHWAILDPFYAARIEDYGYGVGWKAYRYPMAWVLDHGLD